MTDWLAEQFEARRTHLTRVAYRMLGSRSEAEDAVQEAWLRVSRSDTASVDNLGGWLTTIVGRVALDMLRSRAARREEPLGEMTTDPEDDVALADSVGLALLVVLETLAPGERVAFVLHDMFALPFDEIARVVGKSPAAARQMASRARRRVQGQGGEARWGETDPVERRRVVDAFFAAAKGGDFAALLAVLDPEVVVRADAEAVKLGAQPELHGQDVVAKVFFGRARAARPALVDGLVGLAWAPGGRVRVAFGFGIRDGRVVSLDLIADPASLERVGVTMLSV